MENYLLNKKIMKFCDEYLTLLIWMDLIILLAQTGCILMKEDFHTHVKTCYDIVHISLEKCCTAHIVPGSQQHCRA